MNIWLPNKRDELKSHVAGSNELIDREYEQTQQTYNENLFQQDEPQKKELFHKETETTMMRRPMDGAVQRHTRRFFSILWSIFL